MAKSAERHPTAVEPARIDALATLPVFFKLEGRRVVLIGGNEAALWKAELLAATGARVDIVAEMPSAEIRAFAEGRGLTLHERPWTETDLVEAALAVAAMEDDRDAARFVAAARAAGVPFNVIDRPAFCSFQFGAIVNRSPLVIGISTDGAAPVFGQSVRADIEALLPPGFKRWAEAAKAWRGRVQALKLDFASRRRFWERFTALARRSPARLPTEGDIQELLRTAADDPRAGHVSLIGAGPGDPELLTLAAVRALRSADVILFDDLVAPEVLDFARREARRMLVGKTGHGPSCRQTEINDLMITFARAGRRVVRLKSGDPLVFGRAAEEMAALDDAGIPYDVVPGISAAQGAAARLATSLTERSVAQRLQFVTGHARDGGLPDDLDWHALADPVATTALYMPQRTIGAFATRLLEAGAEPGRPAVAVFNATRTDETVVRGTIADIAQRLDAMGRCGPCVVLIGAALRLAGRSVCDLPARRSA